MAERKLTALVVEDDPEVRRMIRKNLERLKFVVSEARTANEATAWLATNVPNLICMDLMLPEQSGYELCAQIRKQPTMAEVPVLVISARALPEDRAHAEEVGADGYLIKPFALSDFLAKVDALTARWRRKE